MGQQHYIVELKITMVDHEGTERCFDRYTVTLWSLFSHINLLTSMKNIMDKYEKEDNGPTQRLFSVARNGLWNMKPDELKKFDDWYEEWKKDQIDG
jgi:hypothetical protein